MRSLSEALGSLKKDERSIVERGLERKRNIFDRANQFRPETGWLKYSREWTNEQKLLQDLDDYHRRYWRTVGPRGPITPEEIADKNWWSSRSKLATQSYNKAYDDYDKFMKEPTVKSSRLYVKLAADLKKRREDFGAWHDAITDKEHESEREKMQEAYDNENDVNYLSNRKRYSWWKYKT